MLNQICVCLLVTATLPTAHTRAGRVLIVRGVGYHGWPILYLVRGNTQVRLHNYIGLDWQVVKHGEGYTAWFQSDL